MLFLFALLTTLTWATPAEILIIRHAEKPESGPVLSVDGEAHAQLLAHYFTSCESVLGHGEPVAIYAMAPNHELGSVRAIQTVKPLADKIGVTPNTSFTKREYPDMVREILKNPAYEGKSVLICWEHKVIREIAQSLGAPDPGKWPGEDFDSVYRLDFDASGAVRSFSKFTDRQLAPRLSSKPTP